MDSQVSTEPEAAYRRGTRWCRRPPGAVAKSYTFNVAIFDDWLEVRRTAVWPSGGSVDDGTMTYADEAAALDLGSLPYRERLGGDAFIEHFRRIADAAKNKRVRAIGVCAIICRKTELQGVRSRAIAIRR